jgi:eukaryotic-like serine/threonine-protein kinase
MISFLRQILKKPIARHVIMMALAVIVLIVLATQWLRHYTRHNEFVVVPDVVGMSLDEARQAIESSDLVFLIQDSTRYNPNFPKRSVLEQTPAAASQVKVDRKIYLMVNLSDYKKIRVPRIVRQTYRQAEKSLLSAGFQIGDTIYKNDIGRDEVISLIANNQPIEPGELLEENSKIVLILGNGKGGQYIP